MKNIFLLTALLFVAFQGFTQIKSSQFNPGDFKFRTLGPYRTGNWISEIAVPRINDPVYKYTWYVGSRNGGV